MQGDLEAMALYAGQSAGLVHEIKSIADIFNEITSDALRVLSKLKGFV